MRGQSANTSLPILSPAIEGTMRLAFDAGLAHYDPPPPDTIDDVDALCIADRFRFATALDAWIEVDGKIVDRGYSGGAGSTTIKVGPMSRTFRGRRSP